MSNSEISMQITQDTLSINCAYVVERGTMISLAQAWQNLGPVRVLVLSGTGPNERNARPDPG